MSKDEDSFVRVGAILSYVDERCRDLKEELQECRKVGVNTPGFNQTLGGLDEMKLLREYLIHELIGTEA